MAAVVRWNKNEMMENVAKATLTVLYGSPEGSDEMEEVLSWDLPN